MDIFLWYWKQDRTPWSLPSSLFAWAVFLLTMFVLRAFDDKHHAPLWFAIAQLVCRERWGNPSFTKTVSLRTARQYTIYHALSTMHYAPSIFLAFSLPSYTPSLRSYMLLLIHYSAYFPYTLHSPSPTIRPPYTSPPIHPIHPIPNRVPAVALCGRVGSPWVRDGVCEGRHVHAYPCYTPPQASVDRQTGGVLAHQTPV